MLGIAGKPDPPRLGKGPVSLLESHRGIHLPFIEAAALLIPAAVERSQHLFSHLRRAVKDRVHQIRGHLDRSGHLREQIFSRHHLMKDELHVSDWCLVRCHCLLPGRGYPLQDTVGVYWKNDRSAGDFRLTENHSVGLSYRARQERSIAHFLVRLAAESRC